ncbi:hypothetical protein Pmani_023718 [Petrolisthes manimaculis]|uniref:Uncharacterized protein n=1 Tax=Petrolisthes manimaculis TaxID=1843537 RepID=A0AAE1PBU4_9EUCA|nr:hypothetical protein Pmani_023718 [Petrolisthes manimaculis]
MTSTLYILGTTFTASHHSHPPISQPTRHLTAISHPTSTAISQPTSHLTANLHSHLTANIHCHLTANQPLHSQHQQQSLSQLATSAK